MKLLPLLHIFRLINAKSDANIGVVERVSLNSQGVKVAVNDLEADVGANIGSNSVRKMCQIVLLSTIQEITAPKYPALTSVPCDGTMSTIIKVFIVISYEDFPRGCKCMTEQAAVGKADD